MAYPDSMILSPARLSTLLRASLLVLLVLGLVIKPALAFVGELHAIDHALATQADEHEHEQADGHDDTPDPDHSKGAHALMHQATSAGAFTDDLAVLTLPTVAYEPVVVPGPAASPVALKHITGPFRPPIV